MAEFMSDLTFVFELFAIAGGLVLLDRAAASGGGYTRLAGWILVVGGIGTSLCTGYFWLKYHEQGDFDHAYSPHMMMDMKSMHMMRMMHGGKKGQGMGMGMQDGKMGPGMKHQKGMGQGMSMDDRMNDDQMPMEPDADMSSEP